MIRDQRRSCSDKQGMRRGSSARDLRLSGPTLSIVSSQLPGGLHPMRHT